MQAAAARPPLATAGPPHTNRIVKHDSTTVCRRRVKVSHTLPLT